MAVTTQASDAMLKRWQLVPPQSGAHSEVYSPRTGHVVVAWLDKFYVFGGTDGQARQADVHEYNVTMNEWKCLRTGGRAPPARSGAQAVVMNGMVWIFGGYTKKDGDYFNDVNLFYLPVNDQSPRWDQVDAIGEAPGKRTDHSVVLYGRSMFVFGGFDGKSRFNDIKELKLDQRRWIPISARSNAPKPRFGHSAVSWENSMYIFGGWDGHITLSELFEYNFASNTWHGVPNRGSAPRARYRHSAVVICGSMYVFGGVDKDQNRFSDLYELNLMDKVWHRLDIRGEYIPSARTFHRAVADTTGRMFILGGFDGRRQNDTNVIQLVPREDFRNYEQSRAIRQGAAASSRGDPMGGTFGAGSTVAGGASSSSSSAPLRLDGSPQAISNALMQQDSSSVRTGTGIQLSDSTSRRESINRDGVVTVIESGGGSGSTSGEVFAPSRRRRSQGGEGDTNAGEMSVIQSGASRIPNIADEGGVGDANEAASALMPEDFFKWQEITDQTGKIYTPRTGHAVVVYNKTLYLMGGTDESARQNDIYQFNVETHMWSMLDNVRGTPPCARSGSKAIVYSDTIFFFGGYTKKDGEYFCDLYQFHIPTAQWRTIDPSGVVPPARTDHSCCNFGPSLYIFGGFDGKSRFDDLQKFSIDLNRWERIKGDNQPMGRFGHSACMYGSSMFVFGGWNGHDTLDDLTEFSTTTQQWFPVPGRGEVPTSRYRHSAIVYGCCMFIFGGVDKRQARFSDLLEFNFDTRTWSRLETMGDPPSARTFHKAVIYGGRMYIVGGFDGQRRNDMYRIALIEERTRAEKVELRKQKLGVHSDSAGSALAAPGDEELENVDGNFGNESLDEVSMLKAQVLEYQKRLEREEERHTCKICYEREINTVILDCAHLCACVRCVRHLLWIDFFLFLLFFYLYSVVVLDLDDAARVVRFECLSGYAYRK
ncbi:unnamed protein product [Amoebophrya sp. A25]|nr:unnamed protein product [Amoebophrya sp. A25]|eukprot:GSA25T00000902001.1